MSVLDIYNKIAENINSTVIFNLPVKRKNDEPSNKFSFEEFMNNYVPDKEEKIDYNDRLFLDVNFKIAFDKIEETNFIDYDRDEFYKYSLKKTFLSSINNGILIPYNSKLSDLDTLNKNNGDYLDSFPFDIVRVINPKNTDSNINRYFYSSPIMVYYRINKFKYYIMVDKHFYDMRSWYKKKESHSSLLQEDREKYEKYYDYIKLLQERWVEDIYRKDNPNSNGKIKNNKRKEIINFLKKSDPIRKNNLDIDKYYDDKKKEEKSNVITYKELMYIEQYDRIVESNCNRIKIKNEIASKLLGKDYYGNLIIAVPGVTRRDIINDFLIMINLK